MDFQRQIVAIDFLHDLIRRDGDPAAGALEGLHPGDLAETLRPGAAVRKPLRPLVERTVGKVTEGLSLDAEETFALEAIIIPDKRPVIDILDGDRFATDHPLWTHLNAGAAHEVIAGAIPAVGRVELPGHPSLPYGGTAFVVGEGLLMTNRHVAELFSAGLGLRDLRFHPGRTAAIDFERRVDGGSRLIAVKRVAMIHPYWDMALLEVEGLSADVTPLRLAGADSAAPAEIVVIGYPAFDPRNDARVQNEVFRNLYNVKRLMPGRLTGRANVSSFGKPVDASTHDSSTTGGASGSAVLDPASGAVVALHFGGVYLKTNYGVPAAELARDRRVVDAGVGFAGATTGDAAWDSYWRDEATPTRERPRPVPPAQGPPVGGAASPSVSFTLPLTVTVALGSMPGLSVQAGSRAEVGVAATAGDVTPVEAPVADYRDRQGYRADFLGVDVPLPEVVGAPGDVLDFDDDGRRETELRYQHFSVKMSRSRRMCFFSAVNIDGGQSRKSPRRGWRLDPRIPAPQQILNECYGNPPKFSRGHMTRREDPIWGDAAAADRGNADSMHVTNTTPQFQAFNSPIWLALEDYALEHAREDAMRISVFTGPYFTARDPVMYGVRIPLRFWKVIAFIHDHTGRLCATGYEMSQESTLPTPETEFVFGEFRSRQLGVTTQTSLAAIEARSGLSFGALGQSDPRSNVTEAVSGGADLVLDQMDQIVFD
ncbi:MAG: DNA/RNA non-specific endonuclease [Pseudomonadota bacterium]|nr:DNA/RNA non-specific endonuclease [Pseudomonadota bacterium]